MLSCANENICCTYLNGIIIIITFQASPTNVYKLVINGPLHIKHVPVEIKWHRDKWNKKGMG